MSATATRNTTLTPHNPDADTSFLQRAYRLFCLALLLICGAIVTLAIAPWCSPPTRRALKASWSAALLNALGIEIEYHSALPAETWQSGLLLVANHISWIDIFVINAVIPAAFIAKAEVRQWPIIGWLAAHHDTIFLRRGSRGHARAINEEIHQQLEAGVHIAVFPEGTTTDGTFTHPFHGALIQPALNQGKPIVPVALSYHTPSGERSLAARYDGDINLAQCTFSLLRTRRLIARLQVLPAHGLAQEDRRTVAKNTREAICHAAKLTLPS